MINDIFEEFSQMETVISVDMETYELTIKSESNVKRVTFQISQFDKDLVQTGGWVDYADKHY